MRFCHLILSSVIPIYLCVIGNINAQTVQTSPDVLPAKAERWLGYDMIGAEPVIAPKEVARDVNDVASHSNIVVVPFINRFAEQSIQAARECGMHVLLYVWTRENMTRLEAGGFQIVKDNPDVVVGVFISNPFYTGIRSSECEEFGKKLKRAQPSIGFWLSLPDDDSRSRPFRYALPDNVDVFVVNVLGCSTIREVNRRGEELWPKWIAKAGHRPVVLMWDSWHRSGKGFVPICEQGTFEALGQVVRDLNLRGLLFATYRDGAFERRVSTGIATHPALVAEVRSIAREWEISDKVLDMTAERRETAAGVPVEAPRPVEWKTSTGENGHFYQVVAARPGITWHEADRAAKAAGGYLATITSEAENDFVFRLCDSDAYWSINLRVTLCGPWLGGIQKPDAKNSEDGWYWVSGEPFRYANWMQGQPNDWRGTSEDRILYYGIEDERSDTWNGVPSTFTGTNSYVIEYNSQPSGDSLGHSLADAPAPHATPRPSVRVTTPQPIEPELRTTDQVSAQADHPFRNARVGDWAKYKYSSRLGTMNSSFEITRRVTANDGKTVTVTSVQKHEDGGTIESESTIDLTVPYRITQLLDIETDSSRRIETADQGSERIKVLRLHVEGIARQVDRCKGCQ